MTTIRSSSAVLIPYKVPSLPIAGEIIVIPWSRGQPAVPITGLYRTTDKRRGQHQNEKPDYAFRQRGGWAGPDRVHAPDGLHRSRLGGGFRECRNQRQPDLDQGLRPAFNRG